MDLFTEFTDHLAVRKILHGVKDRAEGRVEAFAPQTLEFGVLVWAFCAFLVSIWLVLRGPLTWSRWVRASAAGLVWLVVWYAPIPVGVGVLFNLFVLWLLRPTRGRGADQTAPQGASSVRHAT